MTRLFVDTARPRSWLARLVRWVRGDADGLVAYCPHCLGVVDGDREMQRRSARHCTSYVVCTYRSSDFGCVRLRVVWS